MSTSPFPKWVQYQIPPASQLVHHRPPYNTLHKDVQTVLPQINNQIKGLQATRSPSTYWGNYKYMSSNGKYFNSWYDAQKYQELINAGFCDCNARKIIASNLGGLNNNISSMNNSMSNGYQK